MRKPAKPDMTASSVKRPVAPPVYRPQTTPKVLQRRAPNHSVSSYNTDVRKPIGPPIYRPQPLPRVLQRKSSEVRPQAIGQGPKSAPPIVDRARAVPKPQPVSSTKRPDFNKSSGVVQASWWINKERQMVAELDDGEDSISVPEMRERVLAKLNSSGAKYRLSNRVLSKSGIAEGGWVRINLSDFPAVEPMVKEKRKEGPSSSSAVEPVVKEERSAKKLKPFSRSPVALSATPEDPLPPELLRQVFLWVTDLRNILGTPIAIKPRQLMQLSLVCKRWDAIIRQNHKVLGYYPEQIMEINSEVEALKVAPLDASEMMGLALMAKQLLTHFNPDKYTYICLGNSPALIIELIAQSKKPPAILYLPISDIEELEVAPREKGGVLYERLLDYVARIMKDRVKTSHVLLVDMTSTGAALSSIKVLLDDYYQRKHELKTVEMVSLNVMSAKPNEELQHLPLSQIKSLRPESAESLRVAQKIVECRYKNKLLLQMFAKHPIIEIQTGKLQAPALQGPHYQRMREMVKGIIKILKQNGEALDLFA